MGTDREDRRDKETRYSFPHPFPSSVYQLFSSFHHIVVKILSLIIIFISPSSFYFMFLLFSFVCYYCWFVEMHFFSFIIFAFAGMFKTIS